MDLFFTLWSKYKAQHMNSIDAHYFKLLLILDKSKICIGSRVKLHFCTDRFYAHISFLLAHLALMPRA